MAGQEDTIRASGRMPKYRTSCDHCQAAKVKCGHEKPSCRRCTTHNVDCVYSLSRRMGRPRAKKNSSEDSGRRPSNAGSDHNIIRHKPTTPAAVFDDSETAIPVREAPVEEAVESDPSLPGPNQGPDSWTPVFGDLEHINTAGMVDNSNVPPMTNSLDFLSSESPMELDDISGFSAMPSFLEDLSSSLSSQAPTSVFSADQSDPQDLLSAGLQSTTIKAPFTSIDFQPQRNADDTSEQCRCRHSKHSSESSRTESSSGSSNAAQVNQMFDFATEFLSDMGRVSDTGSGTPSNVPQQRDIPAYSRPIATPKSAMVYVGSEESPQSPSRRRAPADQRRAHCNCMSAISQRIVSLKAEQQNTRSIPIDSALIMESEVEESLSRLYRCKNCCFESSVHLLALVSVRMMLDLLQKTAHDEFTTRPKTSSSGPTESSILCIGNFKVTPRARFRFLRKIFQTRVQKLAVLVEERERLVNGSKQDCFSRCASVLLGDISRGLRTIMGWIELWNSRNL